MSEEIAVTVVKPFLNGAVMVEVGDEITVGDGRARELERNGLITRELAVAQSKKAPEPRNKMAAATKNKAS